MKKMLLSVMACVAFTTSVFASNKIETHMINEGPLLDVKNYCDLKFVTITLDGTIAVEIRRGWGFNLDCEKEQAKADKLNDKRILESKGDFRNII